MRPASATAISNAEIYYAIRLEDRKGQPHADRAWQEKRSELSSNHARRCVGALLKNELLKQALDPLLDVPGLRQGLMISIINKLLDARADEEAAAYLHHTYALWVRIVGSRQAATKITVNDVQALELRCPKFCTADAVAVMDVFEQGTIFSSFSTSERDAIRREILSIETFSQDIHVLQVCAASMRHLVVPSRNRTIRQTLLSSFEGIDDRTAATAIQDLWAFVLGNFPDMCLPTPTKAKLLAGPLVQEGRQGTVLCAARLANQLGFRTPEIQRLVSKSDGEPAEWTKH